MLQCSNLFHILIIKHISHALEWIVDVLALQGADLEELEPNALCEGETVLGSHCDTILQVNFVCYYYSC